MITIYNVKNNSAFKTKLILIMKIRRKKKNNNQTNSTDTIPEPKIKISPWKILIIDDDEDIHSMTRLALDEFEFAGKKLQILQAMSGIEARQILANEPKIAVALIDVVMETDDAGLQLIDFIRNELEYALIRLIIRTGQPGVAPEREVIERYDIDDYKDKTELTANKLYTTIRVALKSYRDLNTLDINRRALSKILEAAPELYHPQSINNFFNGVLTQIIGLCKLGEDSLISTISNGFVVAEQSNEMMVQAGTGRFANPSQNPEAQQIVGVCTKQFLETKCEKFLPPGAVLIPLKVQDNAIGFVYLEGIQCLTEANRKLIHIMIKQCVSALENLQLYLELKKAHQDTSMTLTLALQSREIAEAANRAKSTFLAKMSHELRTPLNAIIGYTDLIQEDIVDNDSCEDLLQYIERIQTAGKQLLGTITDILDISRIEADKLELYPTKFAIVRIVKEVVITIQPIVINEGNQLNVDCNGEVGMMYADYNKVRQILLNLLNNATKFTSHGTITFTITRSKVPLDSEDMRKEIKSFPLTISECKDSDWLSFQVTDNGIGIAPEQMKVIFDPFTQSDNSSTREFDGAGLGLPISKHLCQAMGGNILVNSPQGVGTTFTVQLPAKVAIKK
jgi:signal transduction histidine kinase/CheY-like chemotaxis protein